ncbi:MAG: Dps family protein [Bacillus sp. (in: firmicutes)]
MAKKELVELLNKEVSNFNVLYTKLHNYHWFVKGPHFFELHKKLEELYTEVAEHFDALAERLLALEETPVATMKEHLEIASIQEASGKEGTDKMVSKLIEDFKVIGDELKEGITLAEEDHDHMTADMLGGMVKSFEKHSWMLRAYLD